MNLHALMTAADRVRLALPDARPRLALVMGSGWSAAAGGFHLLQSLDYARIPELGSPQAAGHAGRLLWAERGGVECLIFAGRRHWYEGVGWGPLAFPVVLAKSMAVEGIILTNSAGGLRQDFAPGTLMVLTDHLNLMGVNPLTGPHEPFWGPRFPDMSRIYDRAYQALFETAAQRVGAVLQHGVYAAVQGPSYETPAEIAAFRKLGADAIGMSTVPEAILAHAAGLRVAGLSCITNAAAGLAGVLSHEEVLAGAGVAAPLVSRLLQEFITLAVMEQPATRKERSP